MNGALVRVEALAAACVVIAVVCAVYWLIDRLQARRAPAEPAAPSWFDCPECVTGDHGRVDCDEHAAEFSLAVAGLTYGSGPLTRTCAHSFSDAPHGVIGCSCEVTL